MESNADNGSLSTEDLYTYIDTFARGPPPPFSEKTYFLIDITFRGFITGPTALTGLVSNVINIVMFYRQGFMSHSSVVNLTALAITDFVSCLFCVWGAVCAIIDHFFDTSTWSWHVHMFFVYTGGRPYNTVTQVTCWITAFLAFERSISVVFPFKAKSLFTAKRSVIVMISIFTLTTIINAPNWMLSYPTWRFNEHTNRTFVTWTTYSFMLGLIEQIFFYTSPVTLRVLSVFIVVVCNIIIFWKVYLSQKFRKVSASFNHSSKNTQRPKRGYENENSNSDSKIAHKTSENEEQQNSRNKNTAASSSSTTKEMRLVRMITLISSVFIVCYIPSVLHVILYYIVWDWNVDYHWWVDIVVWNVVTSLQIISASTNIFIYFNMSTRYREEFLLCLGKKRK